MPKNTECEKKARTYRILTLRPEEGWHSSPCTPRSHQKQPAMAEGKSRRRKVQTSCHMQHNKTNLVCAGAFRPFFACWLIIYHSQPCASGRLGVTSATSHLSNTAKETWRRLPGFGNRNAPPTQRACGPWRTRSPKSLAHLHRLQRYKQQRSRRDRKQ